MMSARDLGFTERLGLDGTAGFMGVCSLLLRLGGLGTTEKAQSDRLERWG